MKNNYKFFRFVYDKTERNLDVKNSKCFQLRFECIFFYFTLVAFWPVSANLDIIDSTRNQFQITFNA